MGDVITYSLITFIIVVMLFHTARYFIRKRIRKIMPREIMNEAHSGWGEFVLYMDSYYMFNIHEHEEFFMNCILHEFIDSSDLEFVGIANRRFNQLDKMREAIEEKLYRISDEEKEEYIKEIEDLGAFCIGSLSRLGFVVTIDVSSKAKIIFK